MNQQIKIKEGGEERHQLLSQTWKSDRENFGWAQTIILYFEGTNKISVDYS